MGNLTYIRASKFDRFSAYFIDTILIFVFCLILFSTLNLYEYIDLIILPFILKDITGQSFGKKILHLRIVRKENYNGKVNPFITILRNLLLYFPLEGFVLLFSSKNERIADKITNSVVVKEVALKEENEELVIEEQFDSKIVSEEEMECLECGNIIEKGEKSCSKCGWSYKL